jgi:hypothetical protein
VSFYRSRESLVILGKGLKLGIAVSAQTNFGYALCPVWGPSFLYTASNWEAGKSSGTVNPLRDKGESMASSSLKHGVVCRDEVDA